MYAQMATTQQQHNPQSTASQQQHHVCARGVSTLCRGELLLLEPAICHPTIPHISAMLRLRARGHRLRRFGRNYGGLLNYNVHIKPSLHLRPQRQFFFVMLSEICCPHHRWQTPDNMRRAQLRVRPCLPAAAGRTVYCGELLLL